MKSKLVMFAACCVLLAFCPAQYLETRINTGGPSRALLWNPTSNKLYCVDDLNNRVAIINGQTNQLIRTLRVGTDPFRLCWNSRENKVYCSCNEGYKVYVIDGVGDTVLKTVSVSPSPAFMYYDETDNKVYVSCYTYDVIAVVDAHRDTTIGLIPMSNPMYTAVWHPATDRLFVPQEDSVALIDCAGDSLTRTVPTGDGPYPICRSLVNGNVYIGCGDGIAALSDAGDSVAFMAGENIWPVMCWAPCPNKLYAPCGDLAASLQVVDCNTNTVLTTFDFGKQTSAMLCDTVADKVYVADNCDGYVHIFDAWADTLVKRIYVGPYPDQMAWNVTDRRVYVTVGGSTEIAVIREEVGVEDRWRPAAAPRQFTATVVRGLPPGAVAFDAMGRRVVSAKAGVYFVGEGSGARGQGSGRMRKVILHR
jgi:YVTN family beta-propeller protein